MASEGLQFVDHTPVKNAVYNPSDATATTTSGVDGALGGDDQVPNSILGKVTHYYGALRTYKDERFKTLKPWGDFFDRSKFSAPGKMEAFSRANKNVSYFYSNYVVLATVSSLYVLLINPSFLLCLFASAAMYFFFRSKTNANEPIVLVNKEVTYTQAWSFLILFSLLSFYFTGGSSTVFWLVLSSLGTVLGHAMFREPSNDESSPLSFASYVV